MKHKIQRILASLLAIWLLTCPASAMSFPDVNENAEYAEAVDYLSNIGIFSGDDKGNFNPNSPVTRAEIATIICRMLGETEDLPSSTVFTDVPIGHWANVYVGKAVELGIVSGYGDGRFGPSDNVTYEQALTMIVRAMGYSDYAVEKGGYPDGFMSIATDLGYTTDLQAEKGEQMARWKIAVIVSNALLY